MPEFLYKRYKKDSKVEEKIKETFDRFHELDVDNNHYVSKFLEVYEKDKMCGRHLFPLKQVREVVVYGRSLSAQIYQVSPRDLAFTIL